MIVLSGLNDIKQNLNTCYHLVWLDAFHFNIKSSLLLAAFLPEIFRRLLFFDLSSIFTLSLFSLDLLRMIILIKHNVSINNYIFSNNIESTKKCKKLW